MARLNARYQNFWARGKVYRHFWMSQALAGDVLTPGEMLTATGSIVPGGLETHNYLDGQTISAIVSLVSGTASGNANASGIGILETSLAAGQTITLVTLALVEIGQASAEHNEEGQTLSVLQSIVNGLASGQGNASGELIARFVSLIPGAVSADAILGGQALGTSVSLIAGTERPGQLLLTHTALIEGTATGTANEDGAEIVASAILIPGDVYGDANADGQILTVNALINDGQTYVPPNVYTPGQRLTVLTDILPGHVSVSVNIDGQLLTVNAILIPGNAFVDDQVDADIDGQVLTVNASLLPGSVDQGPQPPTTIRTGGPIFSTRRTQPVDAYVHGKTFIRKVRLLPGKAFGEDDPSPTPSPSIVPEPHIPTVTVSEEPDPVPANPRRLPVELRGLIAGSAQGHARIPGDTIERKDWTKYDNALCILEVV